MIRLNNILFPTDFSEHSNNALKYTISLAREYNAKIHVLHVIEEATQALYFDAVQAPPLIELFTNLEIRAKEALGKVLSDDIKNEIEHEEVLRRGVPFYEIIKYAQENEIDLITIATHGRSGLRHALFGSTAEKVVRKAPCPVLSIRHPEHNFVMP